MASSDAVVTFPPPGSLPVTPPAGSSVDLASEFNLPEKVDLSSEFDPPKSVDLASEFNPPDPQKKLKERQQEAQMVSDALHTEHPLIPASVWNAILTKGGSAGDAAASVLPPIAGGIAGSLTDVATGPAGTIIGGGLGGAAGAALTEARQYFRGERDTITPGPIVTGAMLGAIPLPGKFIAKPLFVGGKLVSEIPKEIAIRVAARGAEGAVLGAGSQAAGQLIDTGTVNLQELAKSAAWGALFGAGAGAVESGALTLAQKDFLRYVREKTGVTSR